MKNTCWTADYLLAHCERYRVESEEGTLGYVDEVLLAGDGRRARRLLVRTSESERFTVPIEDVLELHPSGERIVIRARHETSSSPPHMRRRRRDAAALTPR